MALGWVIPVTPVVSCWSILCLRIWVTEVAASVLYIRKITYLALFNHFYPLDMATTPFNGGQSFSSQWASGLVISWERNQLGLVGVCKKEGIEIHEFYWSIVHYNQHPHKWVLKLCENLMEVLFCSCVSLGSRMNPLVSGDGNFQRLRIPNVGKAKS